MEDKQVVNKGVGFTGILTIAFIVLKLLGYIKWSWIWVLAPLWIPAALIILFLVIYIVICLIKK